MHVNDEEVGSSCPRGTEVVYPDCQGEIGEICSLEVERVKKQGVRDCFMCGSSNHLIKQCPVARAPGGRACYICGSFDHLMRDCQEASVQRHMPGIGEIFPFWNDFPLNYARTSQYQIRGSMVSAFNPPMFPRATFLAPSNMPITYGGLPAYRGFMRYGWTPYVAGMAANQYHTSQGLNDFEERDMVSDDNMRRTDCQNTSNKSFSSEQLENHHHGRGGIHFTVGSGNKSRHGSNHPSHGERRSSGHYELSFSDREDSPCNSGYHDKEGSHHSRFSKKHEMKMGRSCDDDLSGSHGQSDKRDLKRNRTERVPAQHSEKHPRSLDRGFQRHGVEVEVDAKCSPNSRDSKHRQASRREERNRHDGLARERWRMTSRSYQKISRGAVTITKAERNSERSRMPKSIFSNAASN
ncbi:hypothetical protein MLD38_005900 [Melastoma candidum]|uniref:Uncharacterized protein n=1 Tax=Melastoma candidum TaxID=119954 RepID=A0ACB9RP80_9MYRT|nr:hypothetical protein MLD38_005900 [Melastoma candidum]